MDYFLQLASDEFSVLNNSYLGLFKKWKIEDTERSGDVFLILSLVFFTSLKMKSIPGFNINPEAMKRL
jgi:hypothetical protein